MPSSLVEFLADVVAVSTGGASGIEAFGSGRVIAPGLVLTSRHLIDHPKPELPQRIWKVFPRTKDGSWGIPSESMVLWRGSGDLDIALLQITVDAKLTPARQPKFAWSDFVEPIANVRAAGFPRAWLTLEKSRVYLPRGTLDINTDAPQYEWSVPPANKPDDPHGWEGMSGAAVCHLGLDDVLIFGVIQEVPANFSGGQLVVARVLDGLTDISFLEHLKVALGSEPQVFKWVNVTSVKSSSVVPNRPDVQRFTREVPEPIRQHTCIITVITRPTRSHVEVWATDHHRLEAGMTASLHIRVRTLRARPQKGNISLKFRGDGIRFGPTADFGFQDVYDVKTSFQRFDPFHTVVPVMISAQSAGNTWIEIQIIFSDPFGLVSETPLSFATRDIGLSLM